MSAHKRSFVSGARVCGVLCEKRRISMRTGSSGRLSGPRRASSRLLLARIATAPPAQRDSDVARSSHGGKRTIAAAANNSLCLRPLVARHTLSLSDFQSEFLHFSFRRQQKEASSGLLYARGEPMYFQNKIQLSESAWMAGGCRNDRRVCVNARTHARRTLWSLGPPARLRRELKVLRLAVHSANPVFLPTHCTLALIGRAQSHLQRARWKFIAN